jgi:hypothetical protein
MYPRQQPQGSPQLHSDRAAAMLHAAASFEAAANSMTTMAANLNTTAASLNEAATSIRTAFTPFRPFQQHQDHYLFGIPMDVINPALLAAQQLDAQGVPTTHPGFRAANPRMRSTRQSGCC